MPEEPVLMENTKINSFSLYNERVFERNTRFFRKVYKEDVTSDMCRSAGMSVPDYVKAKEAKRTVEVQEVEPEKAQDIIEAREVGQPDYLQRPDYTGWTEDQLRDYTQEHDIPIHPSAKTQGLQAAIDRFFDEIDAENKAKVEEAKTGED